MSKLTDSIYSPFFKMDTLEQFLTTAQPGWHIWTLDLRDAYFHLHIAQPFRRFLCFHWLDQVYQFTVLPFGLRSSPFISTKLMRLVLTHVPSICTASMNYIDDFAFAAPPDRSLHLVSAVGQLLASFGLHVAPEKSTSPDYVSQVPGLSVDTLNNLHGTKKFPYKLVGDTLCHKAGISLHPQPVAGLRPSKIGTSTFANSPFLSS